MIGRVIWGALMAFAGPVVGRILLALGIQLITFTGFNEGIGWVTDHIKSELQGMPSQVVSVLSTMQVDTALSLLFSAVAFRIAISWAGGAMKRYMVTGGPSGSA